MQPNWFPDGFSLVTFYYYQDNVSLNESWEVALRTEEDRKANRTRGRILLKQGKSEEFLINLDGIFANVERATKVKVRCHVTAIHSKRYDISKEAEFSRLPSSTPK